MESRQSSTHGASIPEAATGGSMCVCVWVSTARTAKREWRFEWRSWGRQGSGNCCPTWGGMGKWVRKCSYLWTKMRWNSARERERDCLSERANERMNEWMNWWISWESVATSTCGWSMPRKSGLFFLLRCAVFFSLFSTSFVTPNDDVACRFVIVGRHVTLKGGRGLGDE